MTINNKNAKIINSKEVYLHDDILLKFLFDRINKNMTIEMKQYLNFETYRIEFIDVIGFEMSSCDFWGASECILDFEYIEDFDKRVIIPKLMEKWQEYHSTNINLYDDYIETLFTFGSGDCLRIVCKEIEI